MVHWQVSEVSKWERRRAGAANGAPPCKAAMRQAWLAIKLPRLAFLQLYIAGVC
jgi:hypothetical protein